MTQPARRTALAAALACALDCGAVTLDADGLGQALIFPYYTANSESGNPFNTYLSVVNHTADVKAVRVRFREARMAREVLSFNLFLAPNDVWTGAVIPFGAGTRLITRDESCIDPGLAVDFAPGSVPYADFRNSAYTVTIDDGAGSGLDRTREGFVEVLEMATLTGAAAAAVTPVSGFPPNCQAVRGALALTSTAAPSGGLGGTLTLINVASGMDMTLNAEALADLASRPYFRVATDPYPDFAAAEIDPVSLVIANGSAYRSMWTRGIDAVSAVFMRSTWETEYVLDAAFRGRTDVVVTFPTRQFYTTAASASLPFLLPARWSATCEIPGGQMGEAMSFAYYNREEALPTGLPCGNSGFPPCPVSTPSLCAASNVVTVNNGAAHMPSPPAPSAVLGSLTRNNDAAFSNIPGFFQNGLLRITPRPRPDTSLPQPPLTSLASSSRMDLATGQQTTGAQAFTGLPVVGLMVRSVQNGTLTCDAGRCQGNYGGAFPFSFGRTITP